MFRDFWYSLLQFIRSRFFFPFLMTLVLGSILIARIYTLQIVRGGEYNKNFTLSIEKKVDLPGTRGNIYDRNGNLLAYNELTYSITITDTIESGEGKNERLNHIISHMIEIIERNNDVIIRDFGIYVDEWDNYCFAYEGKEHQRFLADIYGKKTFDELPYNQRYANPDDVMEYLSGESKYGVGSYAHEKNKNTFFPQMGYTKSEILDICIIRYRLSLNSFQKYIPTTVATDVSEKTVASIMEHSSELQGVSIEENTLRRYDQAVYFAPVIGYTGRITQAEYDAYSENTTEYSLTDQVGKTGIEYSMESTLKGKKGSETLFVDNLGRVIKRENIVLPSSGQDIYLTIDADLQRAVYRLLEQKIAGILSAKLENGKTASGHGRNQNISVYNVYNALFYNNVIDLKHLGSDFAGDTERAVYEKYLIKQEEVLEWLEQELKEGSAPYRELSDEKKEYESFLVSMLGASNYGILLTSSMDTSDETYLAWKTEETISLREFLMYCISQQWVDLSKLHLMSHYSDSEEIFDAIVEYALDRLPNNEDFNKRLYKYMILNDEISGKEACLILWEQDAIQVSEARIEELRNGKMSAYGFIRYLIRNIYLTPAQLGLEPCSGSAVITDPSSGEVLALVSYPGYDNNRLANTADSAYLAKLNSDMSKPLWNYATQQRTAPGSTFKMITSVAGVEEHVITTTTPIKCEGSFTKLNDIVHNCWIYPGSHGTLTLAGGIENSCNCFFYEVGYRLADDGSGYNDPVGIEKIQYYAKMFGLGETSGVEIFETEPKISDQYPVPSAIGQGTHNYTTAGLARYVTAVANRGTVYKLSLIRKIGKEGFVSYEYTPEIINQIELEDDLWNTIHTGMRKVVGSKAYFEDLGIESAGKTGTAQEATNKPNHALFVGFAPVEEPKIAVAVRIANGYVSDFAAQVACDIYKYYFDPDSAGELINGTASDATAVSGGD